MNDDSDYIDEVDLTAFAPPARQRPCELYLISPQDVGGVFPDRLRAALAGGPVAAFQLRVKDVEPHELALSRGAVVLLDRYYFSSVAYQSGDELGAAQILADNQAFARTPDLLLLLDLPAPVGLARIGQRGARDAFESLATLEHCRAVYLSFATLDYARLIDAQADAETVASAVASAFLEVFDRTRHRAGA